MTLNYGFKPCPICGGALALNGIFFCAEDGEVIEELTDRKDMENIRNPDNALDDDPSEYDYEDWQLAVMILNECIDAVEFIGISCRCGFHFYIDKDRTDFPHIGWLDQFEALANRRRNDGQ